MPFENSLKIGKESAIGRHEAGPSACVLGRGCWGPLSRAAALRPRCRTTVPRLPPGQKKITAKESRPPPWSTYFHCIPFTVPFSCSTCRSTVFWASGKNPIKKKIWKLSVRQGHFWNPLAPLQTNCLLFLPIPRRLCALQAFFFFPAITIQPTEITLISDSLSFFIS